MESRVMGNCHARFGTGENLEIKSKSYLSSSKQSGRHAAARIPRFTFSSTRECNFWMWYWPAGKFTTQNLLLHYFPALNLAVKKFSRIKHTAARKFAFSSLSMEPLLAFPTKPILRLNTTLIQNCTNNATSSKGFFNALKITVTLPRASTNWLFASRISFYLLLLLFTFNLPTTPSWGVKFYD